MARPQAHARSLRHPQPTAPIATLPFVPRPSRRLGCCSRQGRACGAEERRRTAWRSPEEAVAAMRKGWMVRAERSEHLETKAMRGVTLNCRACAWHQIKHSGRGARLGSLCPASSSIRSGVECSLPIIAVRPRIPESGRCRATASAYQQRSLRHSYSLPRPGALYAHFPTERSPPS